jgi:hypothetical protein
MSIKSPEFKFDVQKRLVAKDALITTILAVVALGASAYADTFGTTGNTFTLSFSPVGNTNNAADSTTGYGSVSYQFSISTYAISQDEMNIAIASGFTNGNGTTGKWTGSQPATGVTWYQAAAFVNWLNTSQGYPAAYNLNTEATTLTVWSQSQAFPLGSGAYDLYRNANAHYFLPSEDEYYKAAYYDPNKAGGAGYWKYATGSDTPPTAVASGTATGTAVYFDGMTSLTAPAGVDSAGGLSPYGTMGQSGNVYEWMESASSGGFISSEGRAIRGGFWHSTSDFLVSSLRGNVDPANRISDLGFRVASVVPEPSCTILMIGPCLIFLARRHR